MKLNGKTIVFLFGILFVLMLSGNHPGFSQSGNAENIISGPVMIGIFEEQPILIDMAEVNKLVEASQKFHREFSQSEVDNDGFRNSFIIDKIVNHVRNYLIRQHEITISEDEENRFISEIENTGIKSSIIKKYSAIANGLGKIKDSGFDVKRAYNECCSNEEDITEEDFAFIVRQMQKSNDPSQFINALPSNEEKLMNALQLSDMQVMILEKKLAQKLLMKEYKEGDLTYLSELKHKILLDLSENLIIVDSQFEYLEEAIHVEIERLTP